MSIRKNLIGATLATTVALAFTFAPVTSALAAAEAKAPCYGVNSCKGKSACQTKTFYAHGCKGQNSCKGQGFLNLTAKQCAKKHGTQTEPATPTPSGSTTGTSSGTTGSTGAPE